jgi:iron(III) transport system substrate-binding protein
MAAAPFPAAGADPREIEGAKLEKTVVIYGTLTAPEMKELQGAFEKKYPFLKTDYFRAGGDTLAQRIITEARAGSHLADVYWISGLEMLGLKNRGLLSQYRPPEIQSIRNGMKDKDGFWTGMYSNVEAVGYNTNLVPEREVPRSHEDLLHARWKGQIGLDSSDVEWFIIQLHILGHEKGMDFLKRLARQDIGIRRGRTLLAQLLAAGEYALDLNFRTYNHAYLKAQGAPVAITNVGPLVAQPPIGVALPKNAPHPNGGKLFIDFMISKEGQEKLRTITKRDVARVDAEPGSDLIRRVGLTFIDWADYLSHYDEYMTQFTKIFPR